ncbi:hypothetical protein PR202_gb19030 [Eleusine coracana subsp. coracana]|uniref:Protein root UVB sensitive/RUS domain-containing protein n=1 Tax=Eleusine coracana subsp. coracana TaxID=191504 RepID=A0AAV5F8J8_ELECO|nr:hypothetical protein PR202_gb19030 [Eleusine coracana subsp. coracana]
MDPSHLQGEVDAAAGASWVTVEEWSGSSASTLSRTAVLTASASSLTSHRFGSRWGQIGGRLLGAFVPEGFPGSVTQDYVPFQVWDTLQGLSTYIRAMLSTQWFLRDLTGMLGGILFTFYQGSNLDSNAKMWRLVADFMNDLANYKAVQSLSLTTLNYERSSILLQYFMEHGEALAPQQVSQQEHILPFSVKLEETD